MIRSHCGQRVQRVEDRLTRFADKCLVCGKVFVQRKRLRKGVAERLHAMKGEMR